MEWNLPTILVLAAIALAIGGAVVAIVRSSKNPCSSCDGNCNACLQKKSK